MKYLCILGFIILLILTNAFTERYFSARNNVTIDSLQSSVNDHKEIIATLSRQIVAKEVAIDSLVKLPAKIRIKYVEAKEEFAEKTSNEVVTFFAEQTSQEDPGVIDDRASFHVDAFRSAGEKFIELDFTKQELSASGSIIREMGQLNSLYALQGTQKDAVIVNQDEIIFLMGVENKYLKKRVRKEKWKGVIKMVAAGAATAIIL